MKKYFAILSLVLCLSARGQVFNQIPAITNDGQPVELGMVFRPNPGTIFTGIRFYKPTAGAGFTLSLWDTSGRRIMTTQVPAVPAGWVTMPFPPTVLNWTTFVVSYYSPAGIYGAAMNYFRADSMFTNFIIPRAAGVFKYGSGGGYPSLIYNASNYFVEPVTRYPYSSPTREIHDTTVVFQYRDTCAFDWTKADLTFVVNVDSLGNMIMPNGLPFKMPMRSSGPIYEQFIRTTTRNKVTTTARYTLYKDGAFTKEIKQPDGTYLMVFD